jgi:DNA-binding GntR family transcriptional regulator
VFFQRFQHRMALGDFDGGKRQHRQIVEALHEGKLVVATDILRSHLSWYADHTTVGSKP